MKHSQLLGERETGLASFSTRNGQTQNTEGSLPIPAGSVVEFEDLYALVQ
ncbi:hypothetical protein W911_09265 [Hyphomicrobium nitrativorans NL23]|uniref:Uncharacterized protein n=1 Tax=Hyphomicrobium nitrativorans NL23 TaxID=1029756 RepID=V5SHY2_9HYPH|nr:hypothetical protein W911_09265 [Hyphomicrobium nitrativorans NL23]